MKVSHPDLCMLMVQAVNKLRNKEFKVGQCSLKMKIVNVPLMSQDRKDTKKRMNAKKIT